MENTGISWYSNGYDVWLDNINPSKLKTALRAGLKKTLQIVQKEAKENLKSVTPNYNSSNNKWGLRLIKGVMVKLYKAQKNDVRGVVEIMGKGKSADFRLKFFENGTQARFTKNGWHRGKMKSTPFFNPALDSTKSEVEASLDGNYQEALENAYNKFIINTLKKK